MLDSGKNNAGWISDAARDLLSVWVWTSYLVCRNWEKSTRKGASHQRLVWFKIFVGDIHSKIKFPPREFVDDTKLNGAVGVPGGMDAIQRNLYKLKQWALGQGNPWYQHKLDEQIKSSLAKENLGGLVCQCENPVFRHCSRHHNVSFSFFGSW